jgi:hypothetical protein
MGGCFIILVFLLILGAAIWLVELVVRTPALAIAIAVIAVLAFVGWVRSLNTPAARQRREETLRLRDAQRRVERLKAEADKERLHSVMVATGCASKPRRIGCAPRSTRA